MFPFLNPDRIYDTDILGVRLEDLKELGVEGLLIDLDNTLIAPKTAKLDMQVKYWLELIKQHFKVVVLTNNKKPNYIAACEHEIGLPTLGFAYKPWKSEVLIKALEILDLPDEKIAVIGDRPLTDIWLAHRQGYKSVLIKALCAPIEPKWKYLLRKLEWSFVKK